MYCFYRGLYFIERKDFYMASYFYCTAVSMGFKGNRNNCKLFNGFNTQMIRSLCLLKFLTKFDVVNEIFRGSRFNRNLEEYLLEHQDISICIDFIKEQKTELADFRTFILQNVNFEKCGLKGLMKAAEEEIMFNTIKEKLKIFKRTRISKISTLTQLDYNDIMKILKKKVLEGEINVKYDESEDIIEVIDADPGLKEKVKKTKDLYEKIMEGNFYDDAANYNIPEMRDISEKIGNANEGFETIPVAGGQKIFFAYAPIEHTDWSVIVHGNYGNISSVTQKQDKRLFAFCILMVIFSAAASFVSASILCRK